MQNTTTFNIDAAFMENPVHEKIQPFQIPFSCMGNLPGGRHYGLLLSKKAHARTAGG